MKKHIAFIFFIFNLSFCFAQSYDFIRFAETDGLPIAQIYSIYQHSNGALAIGTIGGGFSLYNGSNFHNFSQNDGLISTTINDIKEDSKGNLWLATYDGISKFNGKNFENHSDTSRKISAWELAIDKNDNIYIASSDGIIKYDGNNFINITNHLLKNSPKIFYMVMKNNGELIFASNYNVWNLKNGIVTKDKRFSERSITGIYKLNNDKIIIVANDSLFSYSNSLYPASSVVAKHNIFNISTLYEDNDNNLWVGTVSNGVYKIKGSQVINFNKSNGFTNLRVSTILEDSGSCMWYATDDGVYYLGHLNLKSFVNTNKTSTLWSVYVNPKNKIFVGTTEKGLFELTDNSFRDVFKNGSSNPVYYQILQDDHLDWWIASNKGLVYKTKNKLFNQKKIKIFDDKSVFSVYKDHKNQIWIGTDFYGLYRFNGNNFIKEKIDSSITTIETFAEDRKNNLWIGTDVGVYKFDGTNFSYPNELISLKRSAIDHIILDRYRNTLWMSAFGKGVVRYDLQTKFEKGKVKIFGTSEGLNDNSMLSIVQDFDGNIWAGTNKGLNKLVVNDKDSTVTIIPFFKSDGLLGSECVQQSSAIDSTGKLLIMTAQGLLTFYPQNLGDLKNAPIPKIVGIKAISFDSTITITNDFLFMKSGLDTNYLMPGTINNVQINYCGLSFPTAKEARFSYKLNGLKWSSPTHETMINYNNLAPGDYTFSVRTISAQNKPSKNIARINFTIAAPYYKTLWFKFILLVLLGLVGVIFTLFRTKAIRKKNAELRVNIEERKKINAVLRQSKEIAEKSEQLKSEFLAQMSHEIRSPIHTILSFTQLLEFELSDKIDVELKESFGAIKKAGRRVVRTIDLILNMSQLQTNTLETHFRLINLTDEILEPLYLEYSQVAKSESLQLEFIIETDDAKIEGDEYSLNQIVANLLNNAIKYTNEGNVTLKVFRNENDKLAFDVSDTGIGISAEYLPKLFDSFTQEEQGYTRQYDGNGLGLALVEKYCKINNATISVQSEKGKGSIFKVVFN